jgi:signal transduction histidine kinase
MQSAGATSTPTNAARLEELGRIILAYSDVTEKLQQSHSQLQATVEQLRRDLAEKDRQLERKNRLAALGEMAAGMAHEIRNPLGGIQLYSSMLAHDLADNPPALRLVRKISAGVHRLEGLVSQTLQFTREISAHRVEADIAETIDQAIDLAVPSIRARGVDCQASGPRPLKARIDPLLLGQAVLNLLLNAAEAIDGSGAIFVNWSAMAPSEAPGRFRLTIRDTGPGIRPDILDRIFNPFFTTKETGTGLGLAIVHRIVEAHDGVISVSNPPGGGAQFEIRI